jgi:LmbE family N-acetylglucosaminyl deacetylase
VNPFQKFISEHARLLQGGKKLPLGSLKRSVRPTNKSPGAPKVLIFSPHPDDECITGGLALRLLREAKWNVINVAVTLGSKRERRAARLRELQNACASLGFGLIVPGPALRDGLERINPEARKRNRAHWRAAVKVIAQILAEHQPRVIFVPHEHDGHGTHIGTYFLVLDALKALPAAFKCHVVETEFWGQITKPNLLVESGVNDVAALVAALACHIGEVKRNAYHTRLPAWMIDNVRRGAELVGGPSPRRSGSVHAGGQGGAAPDFTFATIYRLRKWKGGKLQKNFGGGKFLGAAEIPAGLFKI